MVEMQTKEQTGEQELTKENLPEVLEPKHIQKILKMARRNVYDMLKEPPFHVVRVGRNYKISKSVFFEWLEGRKQED